MKREFLQNFKVGELPLTEEIINAIMAENGRDIEAAKRPFADYDSIKEQLQTAKDGLKAFEGVDVAQLQGEITKLQGQLTDKDKEWQGKLDDKGLLPAAPKGSGIFSITHIPHCQQTAARTRQGPLV